jgi:pyroglutamyl-peptidase
MGQSRGAADRNAAASVKKATNRRVENAARSPQRAGAQPRIILLAGFEPFHGERRNPSVEVVRALDGELIENFQVKGLELPVVYGRAARRIADAIARRRPAAVLGLGQAGGRPVITLERIAVNLADGAHRDNAGRRRLDRPVIRGGPDAYFARLPLRAILHALKRRRIPATLSLSAGSFICNAVMYASLHELRRRPAVPCGFIHLPYDTRQALRHLHEPSMSLEVMVEAVRITIAAIGESVPAPSKQ